MPDRLILFGGMEAHGPTELEVLLVADHLAREYPDPGVTYEIDLPTRRLRDRHGDNTKTFFRGLSHHP